MKPLSSLLSFDPAFPLPKTEWPTKATSQWAEIVGKFTIAYNASTKPNYWYTEKRMALRLSPLLKAEGIGYLEYFYEECRKKDNFGRFFNWSLNAKNVQTPNQQR